MSVRKRKWMTRSGEVKEAWIVDYTADGERHIETFKKKKDADAYAQQVGVDIRAGTHTPVSKSITVAQAAQDWIKSVELDSRRDAPASISSITRASRWNTAAALIAPSESNQCPPDSLIDKPLGIPDSTRPKHALRVALQIDCRKKLMASCRLSPKYSQQAAC